MSFTLYSKQFATNGKPPILKTINNKAHELLPQFKNGDGISAEAADHLIAELYSQYIVARRVEWHGQYIVYTSMEETRKKDNSRIPPTFRKINGHEYVIIDPMSFKKTRSEVKQLEKQYALYRQKVVSFPYNNGYVAYHSARPVIKLKKLKERKKAPKTKVVKKVVVKVIAEKYKEVRTEAWYNALTPSQKKLMVSRKYVIKNTPK